MADTQVVLDPIELAKQLSLLTTSQFPWGKVQTAHLKPVATPRLDHHVFDILISSVGGDARLNGKVYLKDRQDVYEAMENIRRAGFGSGEEFSIPRPVAYLPSLRLLLQEWVEGTQAKKIFKDGDEGQRVAAAEACARWLARFHATAPLAGQTFRVEKFLSSAERKLRLISEAEPALGARCEELRERLRAAAPAPGSFPQCASQGDFWERQIIFAGGRTVVLDWDDYDVADPARDVAHFVVSLERLAGKYLRYTHALDGAVDVFLKTYRVSCGHPGVKDRVPFYKAVYWLRWWKKVIQTRAPGWRELVDRMLDESFNSLAGERDTAPSAMVMRPNS
jgi:aminoglycoside phosphotransferase (APT) family kinase protein